MYPPLSSNTPIAGGQSVVPGPTSALLHQPQLHKQLTQTVHCIMSSKGQHCSYGTRNVAAVKSFLWYVAMSYPPEPLYYILQMFTLLPATKFIRQASLLLW